ncbi:ketol-acid reductoisomerase [Candidatus Saccharibacteria bacterium]|nr:ketol-acid reductoisomerase [Candidatus Saccharibacteria bacterium]
MSNNTFESDHWTGQLRQLDLPGGIETVLDGSERDFSLLQAPFAEIGELTVLGYSSQGPAHAMNLRNSLQAAGLDTRVSVALREGSATRLRAETDGFTEEGGTLVTPEVGLRRADMALMLISDAGMAEMGQDYLDFLRPDAVVGMAHGLFKGFVENRGQQIRPDLRTIGVCPKGMGPSVRRLYEQGSGINASAAWEEDPEDRDLALAWSYGIGAPFTFRTTLDNERLSDLVGERAILLGAVHGLLEAAYINELSLGQYQRDAYLYTVESLVRGISRTISEAGLRGVYEALDDFDKEDFVRSYNAAYPVFRTVTEKIYRDVKSGREVEEVYEDGVNNMPMSNVAGTEMWDVGAKVRAEEGDGLDNFHDINPIVAGLYVAGMMAQIDVLRQNGHHWSEIINESVIEAVDSLNPYMKKRGVDYMVDNCSVTARRGGRKWGPVFQAWLLQEVFPKLNSSSEAITGTSFDEFLNHPAHSAFNTLSQLRPSQSIAVV